MSRLSGLRHLLHIFLAVAILFAFATGCRTTSNGFPFMKKKEPTIEEDIRADLPPVQKVKPKEDGDSMSEFASGMRQTNHNNGTKSEQTQNKKTSDNTSTFMMSSRAKEIYNNLD